MRNVREVGSRREETRRQAGFANFFGLNREILAVSSAMLLMNLGENLWRRFLPKYLQSLGAPIAADLRTGNATQE